MKSQNLHVLILCTFILLKNLNTRKKQINEKSNLKLQIPTSKRNKTLIKHYKTAATNLQMSNLSEDIVRYLSALTRIEIFYK